MAVPSPAARSHGQLDRRRESPTRHRGTWAQRPPWAAASVRTRLHEHAGAREGTPSVWAQVTWCCSPSREPVQMSHGGTQLAPWGIRGRQLTAAPVRGQRSLPGAACTALPWQGSQRTPGVSEGEVWWTRGRAGRRAGSSVLLIDSEYCDPSCPRPGSLHSTPHIRPPRRLGRI